jgi:hypothetical protein
VSATEGALRWISGNSESQAYRVDTPHAIITVQGTTFDLLVEMRQTLVLLQAGQIEVCMISSPRRCKTLSQPGNQILVTFDNLVDYIWRAPQGGSPDFRAACLSAERPPCSIQTASNQPSHRPSSKQSRGRKQKDQTPKTSPNKYGGDTVPSPPAIPQSTPLLPRVIPRPPRVIPQPPVICPPGWHTGPFGRVCFPTRTTPGFPTRANPGRFLFRPGRG